MNTMNTTPNAPTPPANSQPANGGMTFDASPISQATPASALNTPTSSSAPSSNGAYAGMTFDAAPVSTATPVSALTPGAPVGTVSAVPNANLSDKIKNWSDNVAADLKYGTDVTGVGSVLKKMGAHGVYSGQPQAVGNFMASLPLGLLRATKGGAEDTQPGQRWQGAKDTFGGLLDAGTLPLSFASPEAGELAGAGGEAALDAAGNAAKATGSAIASAPSKLRNAFSLQAVQDALEGSHADIQQALETGTKAVQDDWHNTVRGIFDKVGNDAGVEPDAATSLHDVAANVSTAIKAKASSLYRQADAAVGGNRFQRYQDAVTNIKNAIREEVGLDPERDAQLQQRLADAEAGHDAAKETLAGKGLDPGIIDKADSLWRQGSALSDLSRPIQSSISGLRADLQGTGAAVESLSPAKLAGRVNAMYDKGRLQQALGDGGSDDLLTAIEDTKQRLKDVATSAKVQAQAVKARAAQDAAKVQGNINTAKYAAGAALGSVPGYALLKHMLGL